MKISPELWRQIDPLLTEALDQEGGTREAWLHRLERTRPELTALLRQMLARHDRAQRTLEMETGPKLAPGPPVTSDFSTGQRIGSFALIRMLGRGGMGEVWLARQADGRVERDVALKLPTTYLHGEVWRERFRRERDILAKLTHPNIARLFDAGVSEEEHSRGQPYLAMEYVEGESLTEYVTARQLPLVERLRLFRQILAAVAHAHRHLVVHRDLKPANILIDRGGQVKLLDFGIAKLVDDETTQANAELTRLGGRVMTLRYAAPEQVSESLISTATDIYALGVVLHELLTGLSPHRLVREGRALTEAALLGEDPSLPSSLALSAAAAVERGLASAKLLSRQISGDLDAILLKAMRRNPLNRYASVERFDEDIHNHLDHRPVKARAGTWRYLAGRFAVRNKLALVAVSVVVLTVVAGVVMVEYARREAVAQKERAERHFNSVRQLANSLIFDVHDQISNLAGSTRAKQALVENATKYLSQLTAEAGDDAVLRHELAQAYLRLGMIQGQFSKQNIGKPQEALNSFDLAITLSAPTTKSMRSESRTRASEARVQAYREKGLLLATMGQQAASVDALGEALAEAERLAHSPGATPLQKLSYARVLVDYSRQKAKAGSPVIRLQGLERALEVTHGVRRSLAPDASHELRSRVNDDIAWMSSETGHYLRKAPDPAVKRRAIEKFREALAIREDAANRAPGNADARRSMVRHHMFIGLTFSALGEDQEALAHHGQGVGTMLALVAADPGNVQYQQDTFETLTGLAMAQVKLKRYVDALATVGQAKLWRAKLPDAVRSVPSNLDAAIDMLTVEAESLMGLASLETQGAIRENQLSHARRALQEGLRIHASVDANAWGFDASVPQTKLKWLLAEIDAALRASRSH